MLKHISFVFLLFAINLSFAQELTATQKVPGSVDAGSAFVVETTVNRGQTNGFLKFFQLLPQGFIPSDIDSKGGSFTFAENGAKVVWIASPAEAVFTTSYKVKVPADAKGQITLSGKFFFINKNERKTIDLETKTITINPTLPLAKKETSKPAGQTSASTGSGDAASKNTNVTKPLTSSSGTGNSAGNNSATKKTDTPRPSTSSVVSSKNENKSGNSSSSVIKNNSSTNISVSSKGKSYRVQVGAFTLKPKIKGVPEQTSLFIDGMTKCFSGSFATYEEAVNRKKQLISKGFKGSFIVTFENGKIVK